MKLTSNLGSILLAAYLILIGLQGTFGVNLGQLNVVIPILALGAGVCMLLGK